MQVFMPYADFVKTAQCLDDKRLYKQIVECKQILNIIYDITPTSRWKHHPIVAMWKKNSYALRVFQLCCLNEWLQRRWDTAISIPKIKKGQYPVWFGRKDVHTAYQSNLLRKNSEHYQKYFSQVPNDLPYIWVREEKQ